MKRLPLWPSSADKWIHCSGQPRVALIAQGFPQDDTKYSGEGTEAHRYLSYLLTEGAFLAPWTPDLSADQMTLIEDIAEEIKIYAELGGYEIFSEVKLTLDFGIHQMNLYADIVLRGRRKVVILDYKHGEGVSVNAEDNPQLMLYGLAALRRYLTKDISVGIIQPRGEGETWQIVELPEYKLKPFEWKVKDAIKAAYAPKVEYRKGPWCKHFCPGTENPICPAQLQSTIDAVALMGDEGRMEGDESHVTSWWLLDHLEGLRKVIKGVDTAAEVWLKQGKDIPGWVLEERDGRRVWHEPEEVPAMLAEILGGEEGEYKQNKKVPPITITEAERIAKKKGKDITQLIHKPTRMKRVKGEKLSTAMEAIE